MKRLVTGLLVLVLSMSFGVVPAFAAGEPESKLTFDFSAKAAGIGAIVKSSPRPVRQATTTKKSFWKTPWPYVIIGGAVAAGVIIAAASGDGSLY